MTETLLVLANILIPNFFNSVLRLFPMWESRGMKTRTVFVVYSCIALYLCAGSLIVENFGDAGIRVLQFYRTLASLPTIIMPFLILRKRFWQNVFSLSVAWMYAPIYIGTGLYAGHNWFRSAAHPLLVANIVSLAVIAVTLPPLLFILRRLLGNPDIKGSNVWRFIWLLPVLYFNIFFIPAGPFGEDFFERNGFIIIRVLLYCALLLTCYLLDSALRQASENAALKENARAAEMQMAMQREQYERIMENAETVKFMRHDMRHHLTLIANIARETEQLEEYIRGLAEKLDAAQEKNYCANLAVNAVAAHYLALAESEGVTVEARMDVPRDTGLVPAVDLCVVMGNFLENAVEACRRVEPGKKFIRVRARVMGDALSVVVTNSFDGLRKESGKEGVYLSRKTEGREAEGVGLSSVKAICEKHRGLTEYEITADVWKSSALVHIK